MIPICSARTMTQLLGSRKDEGQKQHEVELSLKTVPRMFLLELKRNRRWGLWMETPVVMFGLPFRGRRVVIGLSNTFTQSEGTKDSILGSRAASRKRLGTAPGHILFRKPGEKAPSFLFKMPHLTILKWTLFKVKFSLKKNLGGC